MAWLCTGRNNTELITNLASAGLIHSDRVRRAMIGVDRAHYARLSPYADSPQPIGYSATISAPHMHASAAESLLPYLHSKARVLDIGSGSGYLTHVLANLLDSDEGKVIGIDHIDNLTELARSNMAKSEEGRKMLENKKVEFMTGDGRKGYAEEAPYDAIHVGAAAKEMHGELVEQLRAPGRMFIPIGGDGEAQWIWVVDKDEKGEVKRKKDMGVRYVPLTDTPKG